MSRNGSRTTPDLSHGVNSPSDKPPLAIYNRDVTAEELQELIKKVRPGLPARQ
jgi:hypothetical protein